AAGTPASPAGALASPPRLTKFHVCGYPAFRKATHECVRDQRGTPSFSSNLFACSVHAVFDAPLQHRWRFTYNGEVVHTFPVHTDDAGSWDFAIRTRIITDVPLPGGRWRCELRIGSARISGELTSSGPTGAVVDIAVCDAAEARVEQLDPLYAVC